MNVLSQVNGTLARKIAIVTKGGSVPMLGSILLLAHVRISRRAKHAFRDALKSPRLILNMRL
jgi:hypothetical protein